MTVVYSSEFNRFFIVRRNAHHIMCGNEQGYASEREAYQALLRIALE